VLAVATGLAGLLASPAAARAEDLVVLRDGRSVRVERAETLPDRVRVETGAAGILELPRDVPATATGPRTVELPRAEVLAVFPVPNLPGEARPYAERYGNITRQLTDQVRRDLQRSWSPPAATSGVPSGNVPLVPSGRSGPVPLAPSR
jgi:hypothetical protein